MAGPRALYVSGIHGRCLRNSAGNGPRQRTIYNYLQTPVKNSLQIFFSGLLLQPILKTFSVFGVRYGFKEE
jgi:hypothetical protein